VTVVNLSGALTLFDFCHS
jgi:hypothetical protein